MYNPRDIIDEFEDFLCEEGIAMNDTTTTEEILIEQLRTMTPATLIDVIEFIEQRMENDQ